MFAPRSLQFPSPATSPATPLPHVATTPNRRARSISPQRLKIEKLATNSPLGDEAAGVGLIFRELEGRICVLSLIAGGSAHKNGAVCAGDTIYKVNGTIVESFSLDRIKSLIVGKAGTYVNLVFKRQGGKDVNVSLLRQIPAPNSRLASGPQPNMTHSLDGRSSPAVGLQNNFSVPKIVPVNTNPALSADDRTWMDFLSRRADSSRATTAAAAAASPNRPSSPETGALVSHWGVSKSRSLTEDNHYRSMPDSVTVSSRRDDPIVPSRSPFLGSRDEGSALSSERSQPSFSDLRSSELDEVRQLRESINVKRLETQLERLQLENEMLQSQNQKSQDNFLVMRHKKKYAKQSAAELRTDLNRERLLREQIAQDLARNHEQLQHEREIRNHLEAELAELRQGDAIAAEIKIRNEVLEREVLDLRGELMRVSLEFASERGKHEAALRALTKPTTQTQSTSPACSPAKPQIRDPVLSKSLDRLPSPAINREEIPSGTPSSPTPAGSSTPKNNTQDPPSRTESDAPSRPPTEAGEVGGPEADVGIMLSIHLRVVHLIKDSPAYDCGLIQEGDFLVAIDDVSLPDAITAVRRLRGSRGSSVALSFQKSDGRQYEVSLTRQVITHTAAKITTQVASPLARSPNSIQFSSAFLTMETTAPPSIVYSQAPPAAFATALPQQHFQHDDMSPEQRQELSEKLFFANKKINDNRDLFFA